MPISADYGTLQRVIADEIGDRFDLLGDLSDTGLTSSPIKRAIQSAISKWEREAFYFNEIYASPLFTTVAGQEFYDTGTDPDEFAVSPNVWLLHALISGNRYDLDQRSWADLERGSPNPDLRGQPAEWAYFGNRIRLYPIPDGAYPIRASRTGVATTLSADTDANAWTTDAYDLIRAEAKLTLARDVLHDPQLVGECEAAIYGTPGDRRNTGYLGALRAETMRRARARIRATQF